jgi:hypothetical protein
MWRRKIHEVVVTQDGNDLFRSIAVSLNLEEERHVEIRKMACKVAEDIGMLSP